MVETETLNVGDVTKGDLFLGDVLVNVHGCPLTPSLLARLNSWAIKTLDERAWRTLSAQESKNQDAENNIEIHNTSSNQGTQSVDVNEFLSSTQTKESAANVQTQGENATSATKLKHTSEFVDIEEFSGGRDSQQNDITVKQSTTGSPGTLTAMGALKKGANLTKTVDIDVGEFLSGGEGVTGSLKSEVPGRSDFLTNDDIMMQTARVRYEEYQKEIHYIYTKYATHRTIDSDGLKELATSVARFVRDNTHYIITLAVKNSTGGKNFLVVHSMRSSIFAAAIAVQMGLSINAVCELVAATIIHEIGMLRLPPQLYIVNRRLVQRERAFVAAHTVYGYNIAKSAGLSSTIQTAVLEHHERCNGRGYPRRLTAQVITTYAKIIAVACSVEAITAARPYHEPVTIKEALTKLGDEYDSAAAEAMRRVITS